MCAATVFHGDLLERHPEVIETVTPMLDRFAESISGGSGLSMHPPHQTQPQVKYLVTLARNVRC